MTVLAKLTKRLNDNLTFAKDQMVKFSEKTAADPVQAFTWADKYFEYAAHIKVSQDLLANLGAGLDELSSHLGREVLRRAKYPAMSTSPSSNLMEQMLTKVMAETLEWIEDRLER